jgi:hydrogenase/urease accessory protein HupE
MKRSFWALLLWLLAFAAPARADDLRPGYLDITQETQAQWRMTWKAPAVGRKVTAAKPVIPDRCTAGRERLSASDFALIYVRSLSCPNGLKGQVVGLSGIDSRFSDALIRIAPLGEGVQTGRLTIENPTFKVSETPDRWQVAKTYFWLGVTHILAGFDHLLFVIALVLLLNGAWRIAQTVTAFTIAHSLTLIGTTLGWISVARQPVEITIALSIIFLGVEIVKADPAKPRLSERFPWAIAFGFGLLHGFGFAGALAEIGLPQGEIPVALLTFNLGVEAGQLVIVSGALLVLGLARRYAHSGARVLRHVSAYVIGITASFWLIERALS